jgi:4-hydroxy-tetrahydrodipicolinate synthase
MNSSQIEHRGLWPALLTPLKADGDVDDQRLARHVRQLLANGCAGVTLFGTTGEGPSFGLQERMSTLERLIESGVPAGKILVHTSGAAIPDAVVLTRHATSLGVHGCLVLPPFFLKGVPDAGLVDAYEMLIRQVGDARLRLVLYHIPQVTGVGLSIPVIAELLRRHPGTVIGLKDSAGQREASVAYAKAFMPPMQVWVGNELDVPEIAGLGGHGAVSGVANMLPRTVARLIDSRDPAQIQADLQRVRSFLELIGGYGMTAAFKGVMAVLDEDDGWLPVRPPLRALSAEEFARLRAQLAVFAIDRSAE